MSKMRERIAQLIRDAAWAGPRELRQREGAVALADRILEEVATPSSDGGEVRERVVEIVCAAMESGGHISTPDDFADRILALLSGSGTPPGEGELVTVVRRFVDKWGRNGSKTGRGSYGRVISLREIERLRVALDEYDAALRSGEDGGEDEVAHWWCPECQRVVDGEIAGPDQARHIICGYPTHLRGGDTDTSEAR